MSDRFETFRIVCDDQRSLTASLYPAAPASKAVSSASGGHLAALAPGLAPVPRLVLIASGTCYWRRYRLREQPLMLAMWLFLAPLTLSTLGYWPGRLGVGHGLPPGVVRDWRRWSLLPEYLFDDAGIDARG